MPSAPSAHAFLKTSSPSASRSSLNRNGDLSSALSQQILENPLSIRERQSAQIVPVQMEQIECKIRDVSLPAFMKRCLQVGEIAYSMFVESDRFAIEDRVS